MDKILMPKELTAENGAKALLIGEFTETFESTCPHCEGEGCAECNGHGYYADDVHVSWSTIKEIYAMAVKHFSYNK